VEWSWAAWGVSVAAVIVSALAAWAEGSWRRRPGLDLGFVNHGGMWGDLLLLPMANAAIVPHVRAGFWVAAAIVVATLASIWVHSHWYRGRMTTHRPEHLWPSRPHGVWWRDLSWAGWAHVVYVIGELTLLAGFLLQPMPADVILFVTLIFTIHVPVGLLQPRYFMTGHIATATEQPLLLPLLLALWAVSSVKIMGLDRLAG
jgi:hypothetical protein